MVHSRAMPSPSRRHLAGVALISATLLMTELALTRIFSVVMYYHFAFLAISIALFGLSASGVFAYVARRRFDRQDIDWLLPRHSAIHAVCTLLALMLAISALAALPFFSGGLVVTLAISRLASRAGAVYAADLTGAAAGCLVLIPLLDRLGAPGVVLTASALAFAAAVTFAPSDRRIRVAGLSLALLLVALAGQWSGRAVFDVVDTKGHQGDTILFSKWNSFSRIG